MKKLDIHMLFLLILLCLMEGNEVKAQKVMADRQWSWGGNVGATLSGLNNNYSHTYFNVSIRPELNFWNHNKGIYGLRIGMAHSETYYQQFYSYGYNSQDISVFYRKLRPIFQSPFGIGFDHEIGFKNYRYDGAANGSGQFIYYHFTPVIYFQVNPSLLFEVQIAQLVVNRYQQLYKGQNALFYGFDMPGGSMFTVGLKIVPPALRDKDKNR